MGKQQLSPDGEKALEQVLGYLNFSSCAADPQLLSSFNRLYELLGEETGGQSVTRLVHQALADKLQSLKGESSTFRDCDQAEATLELVFGRVLSDYLEFHCDLLFHQTDQTVFGPFFVGRVCEAVLSQGAPWDEAERISGAAIRSLCDYIGHRPVAALESRKIAAYPHEMVRPIPIYVRGAGYAVGPQCEVVKQALKLIEGTDENILLAACFHPNQLDELSIDPRAYDFDHPANKRPNYHFGQWDPHQIDNKGNYHRFVIQQVTLDALMHRVENPPRRVPDEEVIFEAAAVLAGTILMASGISGSGPDTHDSTVTLTSLLPRIAAYRDAFYEFLFDNMDGKHAERLRKEAEERRQPFGGARQHLNSQLANRRASQLEHVHLALIFARMGYTEAAEEHVDVVPTASARMRCQIDCRLTLGFQAVENGKLGDATRLLNEIEDYVHRAIECGAMIDPWNYLGFDANFSLFPALENSIHDYRADELVDLMEQVFEYYSRIWSEAAAVDDQALCDKIRQSFKGTVDWWRRFAVHEVSSVEASDPLEVYCAAEHVAEALNLWHKGGAEAGDVKFWAPHAEMFDSGKAYSLVIDALLERYDFVASMALLIHWLSQAEEVGLDHGERSYHLLVESWFIRLQQCVFEENEHQIERAAAWQHVKRLFDYMEANAEEYWHPPSFELGTPKTQEAHDPFEDEDEDDDNELFSAAYEDVVYRDSTDDGVEGQLFDTGSVTEDELEYESRRVADRLAFLSTVSHLWAMVSTGSFFPYDAGDGEVDPDFHMVIENWVKQAARNYGALLDLVDTVESHQIPTPSGDHESMVEYDRCRLAKETLLERIVATCVDTATAVRHLLAAASAYPATTGESIGAPDREEDELQAVTVFAMILRNNTDGVRLHWPDLIQSLLDKPLLYVPLTKGGDAKKIVAARVRQHAIHDLLGWLPRLGLLSETRQLLDTSREMERDHPVGAGAVTEFDELFKIGYKSVIQCLVSSAQSWPEAVKDDDETPIDNLVSCLEKATESLLGSWLAHSRTLRLSVLEKVKEKNDWNELVDFIKHYGDELFTQKFFNLGNVRAILHQGVDVWLEQLEDEPYDDLPQRLLDDLDEEIPRLSAIEHLTLILEAIVENYGEYRDYNSTTTQSDRGELLYTLLDFLRVRTEYDRVSWNLKPVVWAHEILVRSGQDEAAEQWRKTLKDRMNQEARKYLGKLTRLQKKHAMSMPTIADRLNEKFIRPMQIDRIRALIKPAICAARCNAPSKEFDLLLRETKALTRKPTGVGLDVPPWLAALEDEVDEVYRPIYGDGLAQFDVIPQKKLSLEEATSQIDDWLKRK